MSGEHAAGLALYVSLMCIVFAVRHRDNIVFGFYVPLLCALGAGLLLEHALVRMA